ncbi:MAG: NAD-dependent epimerase/dehydratase family protein [Planctomycetaceae bacterium]|nr:NAD-dependent epimerase/dehydratase family protein [Planctomycetaceae bacterium]
MGFRSLITGISGFVGGFLAEHLVQCGDRVLGTSPDGRLLPDSAESLHQGMRPLIAWDFAQPEGLVEAARATIEDFAPEVIYHLAALSVQDDCGETGPTRLAMAINVDGTRQVLELAASLPARPRVLFVSTAKVYAPVDRQHPHVSEDSSLGPTRPYGMTKLEAERVVLEAVEKTGCDAVIARAFQHTGPRQVPRLMLPQWARQVAADGNDPIEVHTRDAWLDLCDVRDVARAYRLLAEFGEPGGIYNVGTGQNRCSGDILRQLLEIAACDRPVVETRPGRRQEPIADPARLVVSTGWQPIIPLRQTIADTLAYWRERLSGSSQVANDSITPGG